VFIIPFAARAYFTLDDVSGLDQAERNPNSLLATRPVILDEVQRAPQILLASTRPRSLRCREVLYILLFVNPLSTQRRHMADLSLPEKATAIHVPLVSDAGPASGQTFPSLSTPAEISAAFRIEDEAQIGFWDALIVAAAYKSGARSDPLGGS